MKKFPSLKLFVMIMTLVIMMIAVIVVSLAWYINANRADIADTNVKSDVTPTINAEIPDAFISSELYSGQTGIEYGTEDMPYIIEYTPVIAEAKYLPSNDYYMKAIISGLNVSLSEKDILGNRIKEKYDLNDEEGE